MVLDEARSDWLWQDMRLSQDEQRLELSRVMLPVRQSHQRWLHDVG